MSRARARFTQAEVSRALKGAKVAGVNVDVEISKDGTLRIFPAADRAPPAEIAPKEEIYL